MSATREAFLAPAPRPRRGPLSTPAFVWTAMRNPLAIWSEQAYRERVVRNDWLKVPTVIVNDPAAIRHCLVDNAANYAMQPLRQRVLRPMLRDGLLTAEGELWRRTRRAMAPVFTPRNVGGLAAIMAERSAAFADRLGAGAEGPPRDIANEMTLLTYDILQATLFTDAIAGEPAEFARAMDDFLHRMGRIDPLDILDAPAFLPRIGRLLGHRSTAYFRRLITETAARRRALLREAPESAPRDLLTLLLEADGLSPAEIEDNIITFIGAGHETTARALGWTLYLLANAPVEREKVERELDERLPDLPDPREWADALPRTRAALEEAMRLYPPAPSLNRMAVEDDVVAGMPIPAGASLLVLPWLVHRHEALWERPGHFLPDRFLPENRARLDRFQYIPFGVGPRVCIGASFAMQEGVIALACLLRDLRFDYAGRRPPHPVQKITVQPRDGLPMRVVRRRKSS